MKDFGTLLRQLFSFGAVGTVGFVVDAAVFTIIDFVLDNFYVSRIFSYLAAVTTTWYLNRKVTFSASDRSPLHEWARFAFLQSAGGLVNYAVFAFLVATQSFFTSFPVAAIAVGALAAMAVNFTTAKLFVFKRD